MVPRGDVQYVVSEYGAVNLFGKSLQERAIAMIAGNVRLSNEGRGTVDVTDGQCAARADVSGNIALDKVRRGAAELRRAGAERGERRPSAAVRTHGCLGEGEGRRRAAGPI